MITLDRGTYFELRYLQCEGEKAILYHRLVESQARLAIIKAKQDGANATAAYTAALHAAAQAYGFDPGQEFGWNDEHAALVPVAAPPPGAPA